jgi:hypothetical protein
VLVLLSSPSFDLPGFIRLSPPFLGFLVSKETPLVVSLPACIAVGFAEPEAEEMTVEEVKLQAAKANGGHGAKDQFPVGMRVLAVDDDPTCLRLLEQLLQHCQYHGMPCSSRSSVSSLPRAFGFILF